MDFEGNFVKMAFCPMNSKSNRSSYMTKLAILSNLNGAFYINIFTVSSKEDTINKKICNYKKNSPKHGEFFTTIKFYPINI